MTKKQKNTGGLFLKKFSFIFAFLFVLILFSCIFLFKALLAPINPECTNLECRKTFIIPKNQDLSTISERLEKEDLIKSAFAFKLLVLKEGKSANLQAGSFYLKPSMTNKEILENLIYGKEDVWITFPEGWRREQYADRLEANLEEFERERFLELTEDLEGYLFPDTYLFPKETSADKAVEILKSNFDKKWKILENEAKSPVFSQKEILTLASIIEREAKKEEDMKIVAGILLKRLEADWPLQVDATIQFIKANSLCNNNPSCNWWPQVYSADLKVNSQYNTYLTNSLPPGPICNPGLNSIKSVFSPTASDYWFYITGNDGKMYYSKTSEEHNKNISLHLR
jgi:UPF0755 protein